MASRSVTLPSVRDENTWVAPAEGDVWYRIGPTLGSGGMSVVVRATDLTLDRGHGREW